MASAEKKTLWWCFLLALHCFVAVAGGMLLGFLPEALIGKLYYNTGFEAYSPAIALTALLLGYFVSNRIGNGRSASWVWIIGFLWLLFGICDETRSWSATWSPEKTRWGYTLANFFGPTLKCSGSECLDELFFTTPFTATVVYSIGAYVRKRRMLFLEPPRAKSVAS
ncbi:MAG: hypothetical protein WCC37_15385 [Candidatus Sulfotelmatobacter sp.]|jgi:hypothetical protein